MIVAIDPGPVQSAVVVYAHGSAEPIAFAEIMPNDAVLEWFLSDRDITDLMVIEMIEGRGMPVSATVFDTCVWIGRFIQQYGAQHVCIFRREIKLELCGSTRAKDANVRQALIDKFGGSKELAIGTKRSQGPLYGIKKDLWAALGVAVAYHARADHAKAAS